MAKFTEVLKSRNFFFLWIGQIISQFGDRLTQMALIALIAQRAPSSAFQLAKIISFTVIPVFVIGPVAGVYVDRWDRRKTLYLCDFLRCGLVLLIPLMFFYKQSILPIYIIVFLIFCVGRFFVLAKMSIVPDLVEGDNLILANSLITTTGMIASFLGFGLSGLLISWVGAQSGFYIDSMSFFISAALIFLISKRANVLRQESILKLGKDVLEVITKSVAGEIKEGFIYLIRHRELLNVAGILFLLGAALGSISTAMIIFVQKTLHSITKDLGFLMMILAGGLFCGSIIYGKFGKSKSLFRTIFLSLAFTGAVLIIFSFILKIVPCFLSAAVLAFILGMVASPILTAYNTLIHQVSHTEMRGKVFNFMEIVAHLAFLAFMLPGAFFADRIGHERILVGAGFVLLLVGILGVIFNDKDTRT